MNVNIASATEGSRGYLVALVMLAFSLVGVGVASAAPLPQSSDEGKEIFDQRCTSCHTVGGGDLVGPDLAGVTERRDIEWLKRWIAVPDEMLAEEDPIATKLLDDYNGIPMPNLGLSDDEVLSLVAYLEGAEGAAEKATGEESQSQSSKAAVTGNTVLGKNLFTGADRFQHGGPSCRACHSITGIGALGGGALGPELTGAYQKLGPAMIDWPETVAPMKPIYDDKPLTEEEKAHLLAFFSAATAEQRPAQAVWQLTGLAVGGVVVLLLLAHVIWRRRLRGVRRPMVSGQARSI